MPPTLDLLAYRTLATWPRWFFICVLSSTLIIGVGLFYVLDITPLRIELQQAQRTQTVSQTRFQTLLADKKSSSIPSLPSNKPFTLNDLLHIIETDLVSKPSQLTQFKLEHIGANTLISLTLLTSYTHFTRFIKQLWALNFCLKIDKIHIQPTKNAQTRIEFIIVFAQSPLVPHNNGQVL